MLAEALEQTLEDSGCKPVVMKYGIKLPGEEVFELLLAAKEAMAHQMDSLTLPYKRTHTHTLLQL